MYARIRFWRPLVAAFFLVLLPVRDGGTAASGVLQPQWSNHLSSFLAWRRHETSLPAFSENYILIGSQNKKFYALNRANGRVMWTFKASSPIRSQAGVSAAQAFFGDEEGNLHALELGTGKLQWRIQLESLVLAPPIFREGVVYIRTMGDRVLALDALTGKQLWEVQGPSRADLSFRIFSTPLLNDSLYVGLSSCAVLALNPKTGEIRWERNLIRPDTPFCATSHLIASGDRLLVPLVGNGLAALNKKTGEILWFHTDHDLKSAVQIREKPEMIHIFTFSGKIYEMTQADGKIVADWRPSREVFQAEVTLGEISGFGPFLLVGDRESRFYVLDAWDGKKRASFAPFFRFSGFPNRGIFDPACAEGIGPLRCPMALWSEKGTLYLFEVITDGRAQNTGRG